MNKYNVICKYRTSLAMDEEPKVWVVLRDATLKEAEKFAKDFNEAHAFGFVKESDAGRIYYVEESNDIPEPVLNDYEVSFFVTTYYAKNIREIHQNLEDKADKVIRTGMVKTIVQASQEVEACDIIRKEYSHVGQDVIVSASHMDAVRVVKFRENGYSDFITKE